MRRSTSLEIAHQEEHRQFPASARSPRDARRWLDEVLEAWSLAGDSSRASLVLSELVTNAVRHGAAPIVVSLCAATNEIRMTVADNGAGEVVRVDRGLLDSGGRGLHLVAELSRQWGVDPGVVGKTVWADVALDEIG